MLPSVISLRRQAMSIGMQQMVTADRTWSLAMNRVSPCLVSARRDRTNRFHGEWSVYQPAADVGTINPSAEDSDSVASVDGRVASHP